MQPKISSLTNTPVPVKSKDFRTTLVSLWTPNGKIWTLMEPEMSPSVVTWATNHRPSLSGEALPSAPVKNQEPPMSVFTSSKVPTLLPVK